MFKRFLIGAAALASSAALVPTAASAAGSSIVTALSANHVAVEVVSKPAGTSSIDVAVMRNMAGEGLEYLRVPATTTSYTPPAATPVVDMVADDSSGKPIGSWAGRLQTLPPAAAPSHIATSLSATHVAVDVVAEPAGTSSINVAVMRNMAGEGLKYLRVPATTTSYTPPAATPVVDMVADDSSGKPIGSWAGRLQTVPAEVEAPHEEPTPSSSMVVGLDTGGWGGSIFTELIAGGIGEFRVQQAAAAGVPAGHVASVVVGTGGTIGAINPSTYAAEVASVAAKTHPLAVEVLNEPSGPWFWSDPTNYSAYTRLAKAAHEAAQKVTPSPAVLCTWDGGQSVDSFGRGIKAAGALPYCDGVVVHPYGGASGQHGGALGDRANVERAHSESGLPVYVTEIGWPTAVGQPSTGDSQQWTEAQQAANIKSFVAWARATGYVRMVIVFNGVDYGSNAWYGVERPNRTHKPSFQALAEAAK
jgi:hypothetical protein